jgi:origin recognition complex subunit 1
VTTTLPVALLLKTLPIYSLPFFKSQFEPTKSVVKGWEYVRTGVYFCAKAFDKSAKGGKVHSVDIDEWREGGKRGLGWDVRVAVDVPEEKSEPEASSSDDEGSVASAGHGSDEEDIAAVPGEDGVVKPSKRKRTTTARSSRTAKKPKTSRQKASTAQTATGTSRKTVPKGKKLPHPKSSTSHLPLSILSPDQLPRDPYERALRLLHVGATPESLPCREEEFVDVLSRVEEGVETGGGGCLCRIVSRRGVSAY